MINYILEFAIDKSTIDLVSKLKTTAEHYKLNHSNFVAFEHQIVEKSSCFVETKDIRNRRCEM